MIIAISLVRVGTRPTPTIHTNLASEPLSRFKNKSCASDAPETVAEIGRGDPAPTVSKIEVYCYKVAEKY